jgi:hypothetical protein
MDLMLRIEFHWIGFREKIYRKPWFFLIKKRGGPVNFPVNPMMISKI